MATFSINIYGLDDLKESLNIDRINKKVAFSLGQSTLQLHKTLEFEIAKRYTIKQRLSSALDKKSSSTATFGRNVIRRGLSYTSRPVDLAKFPYSSFLGNINPGAKRKGRVHEVSIRRGKSKIVYGKDHRGGFAARNRGYPRYGIQMFERKTSKNKPLRVLFGPSLTDMALWTLENNTEAKKALDNLSLSIIDLI